MYGQFIPVSTEFGGELCYLYLGDPSVLRCTKIICPQLGTNVSLFEEDEIFLFTDCKNLVFSFLVLNHLQTLYV